jgi:hypothetical protein
MGRRARELLAGGLLVLAAAGCGGGETTGSIDTEPEEIARGSAHAGGAREHPDPNGESTTARFGREASKTEREQASRVITS